MTAQSLSGRVHVVVLDPVLSARLLDNGGDLGVMGLDDAGEQVMSGLVVEGPCEHGPEPATCGVVLCRRHLKLRPKVKGEEVVIQQNLTFSV